MKKKDELQEIIAEFVADFRSDVKKVGDLPWDTIMGAWVCKQMAYHELRLRELERKSVNSRTR